MLAIALVVGFGLSYFSLVDGRFFGAYRWGAWVARPEVGSPAPDPYTRAYLARTGTLQLGRGEGVQFIAVQDSEGQPLMRNCAYRVSGDTPVAAFWTLRATTPEGINIAQEGMPLSMHSTRLARSNTGVASIHVSSGVSSGNWLQLAPGTGEFQLVLTFYDASFLAGFGANVTALPAVIKEGCA